ncbi:ArfGap-domain-containing protein [Phanerochaete sordida]|uniref:ArfGap-domain-containing protein n=1 Tax=Phanerochaete sordida TaxID=48140 RepID=A0A9P3FY36_9APHY|nr:ArfGap-domain-containing protein [Phanerochaete sordida]
MDQAVAKRTLQDLIKNDELGNKKCVDCGNPNPQWASVSFAVFLCLQCAGVHRGFGVHVSFVRSVSMDTWQEEQIKRMQLGGNAPFKKFLQQYPAEGGWNEGMNPHDTYHSWTASQYREKLDCDLAGKSWSPSSPPAGVTSPAGSLNRPDSAQGLRKSRASARSATSRSESPYNGSPSSPPNQYGGYQDQKTANENYFANLGQANASRSADLPPSQGGKYQGFGNTPAPSTNPAFGLSSAAAPSLGDFQESPVAALGKSWSLFSSAVMGATRTIQENVIQPGMQKVMDPEFQAGVRGYVSEAGKRAGEVGGSANSWMKQTIGVDVAESVGGVVGTVRDRVGAGPQRQGYGQVQSGPTGETSALYQDHEDDDDFFGQYQSPQSSTNPNFQSPTATTSLTSRGGTHAPKKSEDWDDWKDF